MRKNWKKILSLVLAASLVLSLNTLAFAEEAPVEEAAVVEGAVQEEVAEYAEVEAPVYEEEEFAVEAAAPMDVEVQADDALAKQLEKNTVSLNFTEGSISVSINYTLSVDYIGRSHIEKGGKEAAGKKPDVDVQVVISANGKKITPKKTKLKFKFNKDAAPAAAIGKLSTKPKKSDGQPYFQIKFTLEKADKKALGADLKKLNAIMYGFRINKCDLATLSANGAFKNATAKYDSSQKAKVKKIGANGAGDEKTKLSGLKYVVSWNHAKKGTKYKKFSLKQNKKNNKATDKQVKDFYVVSANGTKAVISANTTAKNFCGFATIDVKSVQ